MRWKKNDSCAGNKGSRVAEVRSPMFLATNYHFKTNL
jgi:hypothetical protein